jgi:hypothetical protein
MAQGRSGGTQYAFELETRQHIGKTTIGKRVEFTRIVGLKSGSQNQGPDPDMMGYGFLFEVYCTGRAVFLAGLALTLLEIDAMLGIDDIF